MWQGDVDSAYLNAKRKIKQYIRNIEGFDYGMYRVDQALYVRSCLYFYTKNSDIAFALIYVEDVVCTSNSEQFKCRLFSALDKKFGFKDMGLLTNYLGIRVRQTNKETILDQEQYARKILKRFDLEVGYSNKCGIPMETNTKLKKCESIGGKQCNHETGKVPYREAVGSLMYLATGTRPDLTFVVGQLGRFAEHPTEQHVGVLKRVKRYLLGTVNKGITYDTRMTCNIGVYLEGHSDSDWVNDLDTRKSTTGYVFTLMGDAISWTSRRQTIVAQSTAEAEYVAACEAAIEGKTLMNILDEMLPEMKRMISLGVDNQSMATNPTFGRRSRHIDLQWHYVREQVRKNELYMLKVKSENNPADLFTKPLAKAKFEILSSRIDMRMRPPRSA
ncbi:Copiatype Polyprotein [Phytophthora palmivora]|uniref:Copiatype Polyprotein n=1 Tax=Phytophthora palmivora TaxID=4796 RepID=A0A2P4Y8J7_9STRA|nr:Copiatype Polyprotein [Phytophthora palmivora]